MIDVETAVSLHDEVSGVTNIVTNIVTMIIFGCGYKLRTVVVTEIVSHVTMSNTGHQQPKSADNV